MPLEDCSFIIPRFATGYIRRNREKRNRMKAYPSCVQELRPLCIGVGAVSCEFDTIAITSGSTIVSTSTRRKRIRRAPTQYFSAASLPSKRHVVASTCAATPYSHCPTHHLFTQKLPSPPKRNCCSRSSSNDADSLGEVGGNKWPGPESVSNSDSNSDKDCGYEDANSGSDSELLSQIENDEDGVEIQITKIGKRSRRIKSRVRINASLSTIWDVLTDYERLADFIPGLALSRLLEKRDNYARLFQIGQQNLALGLKFNAKAVLDCYEKDLENLSFGQRRDIEFSMVEGDFEIFEGKWSIEQYDANYLEAQEFHTILSYVLKAEPKLWLPVRLVEGRLCSEIKTNLSCVRKEAEIRSQSSCS